MRPSAHHDPQSIDRVLSAGRPSGPELDAVWSRLSTSLDEAEAATAPRWWARPWAWASGLGVAVAAAAVLVVVTPGSESEDGFAPRGDVATPVRLEASCGAVDAPCSVGEEVALRIHSEGEWTSADVFIKDGAGRRALSSDLARSGASTAVPVLFAPDAGDVASGLEIEVVLRQLDGEERHESIRLHVVSP